MPRTARPFMGLAVSLLICLLSGPARANSTIPGLPDGWDSTDIGTSLPGYIVVQSNGAWSIAGSGADIWGLGDAFRYTYTSLTGDFSITCRVTRQTVTDGWAKVGVMIRDTLDPGSRHLALVRTPNNGVDADWRLGMDQQSFDIKANAYPGHLPVWLRVQRNGSLFMAFASQDGSTWKQVGSVLQIDMGSQVTAGIAVSAHNDGQICLATVDHVSISSNVVILGPDHLQGFPGYHSVLLSWYGIEGARGYNVYRLDPNGPIKLNQQMIPASTWFYVDSGLTPDGLPNDVTQRYQVTAVMDQGETLPSPVASITPMAPILNQFIGYDMNTSVPGHASLDAGTQTVSLQGSGDDIWDNYDRMYFLAAPWRGAVELSARILNRPARSDPWAKVGLMLRQSLDDTSRNVFLCATPDHGLVEQWRQDNTGGSAMANAGAITSYPLFLRIRRSGDLINCYRSDDGTSYSRVGQTVKLNSLLPDVFIGFAATAHHDGSLTNDQFDQISVQ